MSEYVMVKRKDLARWKQAADDATAYVNHPATSPSLQGECQAAALEMKFALENAPQPVPDAVWEALQRMIEDGGTKGPASREDALTVARHRDRHLFMRADPAGNPLDTPLPCDITVGHGTMRKGVKLGTLVIRMRVLYQMAGLYGMNARDAISQAALDVLAERQRQISAEGYTPEHDDEHTGGELAQAAACYALAASGYAKGVVPPLWPWALEHWKPEYGDRDLIRAGALIQSELERRHRAAAKAQEPEPKCGTCGGSGDAQSGGNCPMCYGTGESQQ